MSRCQTCVHSIPIFVTSDIYTDGFGQVCCDCKTKVKDGYKPRDKTKNGEWAFDEKGYFYCDQCGKYPHDQYETTDFCPNCGSDMRLDSKEHTDPIIKAIQENNAKYNERPSIDFSRMSCDLGENNEVKKNESY